MNDTVGETVATTIDGVIASAEARVEAAEAVNEALTEAAIRDKLSSRIGDCEEGVSTCQSDLEEVTNDLQALEIVSSQQSQTIAEMRGLLTAQAETIGILMNQGPSIPSNSQGENSRQSDQQSQPQNPENPQNEDGEGHAEVEPESLAKPKRGRLI